MTEESLIAPLWECGITGIGLEKLICYNRSGTPTGSMRKREGMVMLIQQPICRKQRIRGKLPGEPVREPKLRRNRELLMLEQTSKHDSVKKLVDLPIDKS